MDMEKCNPVTTPGLQVREKDLATEEQLGEVLAGLYRHVTGRRLNVAGERSDVQQAVKELARGMSSTKKHSSGTAETRKMRQPESCSDTLDAR